MATEMDMDPFEGLGKRITVDERIYRELAAAACHRAGLTVEDLEQDAIGKLVEAAKDLHQSYENLCQSWDEWCGSVECLQCGRRAKKLQQAEAALRPFEKQPTPGTAHFFPTN